MNWKDSTQSNIPSTEMKLKWPKMMFVFLQDKIKWIFFKLQTKIRFQNEPTVTENPNGDPIEVLCKVMF